MDSSVVLIAMRQKFAVAAVSSYDSGRLKLMFASNEKLFSRDVRVLPTAAAARGELEAPVAGVQAAGHAGGHPEAKEGVHL